MKNDRDLNPKTTDSRKDFSVVTEKTDGRGKHPNSRANLKEWEKGESGNPSGRPHKFVKLKKSLDRAVSRVESENSKFQKMKQYKGKYKRWERTAQSVPLISNETIAIANAIKTATKLPSSAQDILDTNKVSNVELEQQIQQDFKISPQEFEREIEQEFNALPDDVRLGVYNNDINNYRTAMINRMRNAAVYGKAPQGAVEQLLNSLQ